MNTKKNAFTYRNNEAHKVLKPEDYISYKEYAFTFNPSYQPLISEEEPLLDDWFEIHIRRFNSLVNSQYYLVTEISGKGRLHFHGTIRIGSRWKFLLYDLQLLMTWGTLEIDEINDPQIWRDYMFKSYSIIKEMLYTMDNKYDYILDTTKESIMAS